MKQSSGALSNTMTGKKAYTTIQSVSMDFTKNDIQSAQQQLKGNIWLEGLFGLEKENIRVDRTGNLSQTPHPKCFGDKSKHPYITTDFSESQIEMRTPPLQDINQMLGFMETVHDIVSLELENELLWPQSIPPILPNDNLIPLAVYNDEQSEERQYREFLSKKYGPKNQLFSGIHFNLSFSEQLLTMLYQRTNGKLNYEDFKDEIYLKATRQLLRHRWLYLLLFGCSPVVDSSMELKCKLASGRIDKNVIGLSIRNSCYGYQNFDELYPDYTRISNYKNSIDKMVHNGLLATSKELYSPVRPKYTTDSSHISYLELRFIDIDPQCKVGISKEALYFLHALALYGLMSCEPDVFDSHAQSTANYYHGLVALHGLSTLPFVHKRDDQTINIWAEARQHIEKMKNLFLDRGIDEKEYELALNHAGNLVEHPKMRSVHEVMNGVVRMGYIAFHLEQACKFLENSHQSAYNFRGMEDLELSSQLLLKEAVKRGVEFDILDRQENFIRLKQNGLVHYIKQATMTSLDNFASILAMENKQVTKKILKEANIRVPEGWEYTMAHKAKADYPLFKGKPIVIKPNNANFGIGITILKKNLSRTQFIRAIDIAFEIDSTILIEEFIEGKEFRFFLIENEVLAILQRVPANVTGDGKSSIQELIHRKNQDPLRGKGYRTPLEKIEMGEAETMFLRSQNLTFNDIPALGEIVYLRENSNISTGGDSIDFTDEIPVLYKHIARQAAIALNVKITGLDMIIADYTNQDAKGGYAIIELNFNPAIHIHCHPYKGKNRKLAEKLMDALGYPVQ